MDDLSNEDCHYAKAIHELFHAHYNQNNTNNTKPEGTVITSLTNKLQDALKEIQNGARKASRMSNQIQDQKETIQHLEMQLNSAHASIRNTKDLEGVLRMVATCSDYKLDNQRRNNDYDGNENDSSNEAHVIDTKKEMKLE